MTDIGMTEWMDLAIGGMHCEACIARVRQILQRMDGIEELDVTLGAVHLRYYPMAVSLDEVLTRIRALGYTIPQSAQASSPLRRFLDSMTRANDRAFGGRAPTCCSGRTT